MGLTLVDLKKIHQQVASSLGVGEIVKHCYSGFGTEYEKAIKKLVESESSLAVQVLDDGKQQNVPDLLIRFQDTSILLECKTAI